MGLSIYGNQVEPQGQIVNTNNSTSKISFKSNPNNTLERKPNSDTFDSTSQKKKSNKLLIALSTIGLATLAIGAVCYSKGKAADDVEKSFSKQIKDGWDELLGKNKKNTDLTETTHTVTPQKEEQVSEIIEVAGKTEKETLGNTNNRNIETSGELAKNESANNVIVIKEMIHETVK